MHGGVPSVQQTSIANWEAQLAGYEEDIKAATTAQEETKLAIAAKKVDLDTAQQAYDTCKDGSDPVAPSTNQVAGRRLHQANTDKAMDYCFACSNQKQECLATCEMMSDEDAAACVETVRALTP